MPNDYATSSRVLRLDDYLPLTGLSLERAAAALPENLRHNYVTAWDWFMQHSGTVGSRMLGKRIPGVSDDFPISAQRGIHVPAKTGIAVSVTVSHGSIYSASDQPLIPLPNGTWILEYSAHRNNTGGATDSQWNDGLINCLRLGLPVGVFIQERGSEYVRYLAYVEEYHADRDVFTLHGPVDASTAPAFAGDSLALGASVRYEYDELVTAQELEEDNRRFAAIRQVIREGQGKFREKLISAYDGKCAGTGCPIQETLQAAHIIGYRGYRSNTVNNGVLLRADLHLLFDNSLLSIDPGNYSFAVSNRIADTEYGLLHGKQMSLPSAAELWPREDFLSAHFEKFQQIELAS